MTLSFSPAPQPTATVLVSHGYAEHSGRFRPLIDALNAAGLDVFLYDHRGHGVNLVTPLAVDVALLIDDHLTARAEVAGDKRTDKVFCFGHSMGGLITAASVLRDPEGVAGVVLTGPAFLPLPRVAPLAARAGRALARLVPRLPTVALDASLLSHDPKVVAAYRADPLVYTGRVSLLTGASMAAEGYRFLSRVNEWPDVPALVIHGEEDGLADISGSRRFAAAARGCTFNPVPGAYHEVLNEPEGPHLTSKICEWIVGH